MPTRWRRKPAGIDNRNYVTVALCIRWVSVRDLGSKYLEQIDADVWNVALVLLYSFVDLPFGLVFTARRYAGAVFAVVMCPSVCPSVCLSVTSRYYIETTGQIELLFSMKASFHLSHTVLGISRTIGLRKFRHLQVDHVVNKTRRRRRRSRLLTAPIRQSTSRGCLLQVGQQL